MPVRILGIVNDPDVAAALGGALSDLGHAFSVARNGEDGLTAMLDDRPDIVLCDAVLPRMTGLELLERVAAAHRRAVRLPFVFLTVGTDRDGELAGRRAGAAHYLPKPVDLELLQAMVTGITLGLGAGRAPPGPLTTREREALTWAGRGKTSSEIAVILAISERTVNFHCDQAIKRLDVVNRTQAVARAMTAALIAP